ncbi:HER220Cp [Eremothecium sinecaudum]|uniref:HER220Cp n=1 Tax=Eremothecium sinecaudum TaxID=45286 RepID=A0A120K2G8_9SACH|nr:HER220Cp [Eremothecium sinecaudum]AMD21498.1 HER220Cp [Eremothecium sinecaudum]
MAFKSFKYKVYSKGYHSVSQKPPTAFFDSSYQYLKHNQGLVCVESVIPHSLAGHMGPHPKVLAANVNFKSVENVLDVYADEQDEDIQHTMGMTSGLRSEEMCRGPLQKTFNARRNSETFQFLTVNNSANNVALKGAFSKSYYSTSAAQAPPPPQDGEETDCRLKEHDADEAWERDTETSINTEKFLKTTAVEIERCMSQHDYNKVNSLYLALKRNGALPTLDIFKKVLRSIKLRNLDFDDLDNRMFQLLNCYHDMVFHKVKPDNESYGIVIGGLLKGCISAFDTKNPNGRDFFKIALDLFFACNSKKERIFHRNVLDRLLLAINIYPGHVQYNTIIDYISSVPSYNLTETYYIAMLNLAKLNKDEDAIKSFREEFESNLSSSEELMKHKYEVYSMLLSALIETNSIKDAGSLLDTLMMELRESAETNSNPNLENDLSLVLSNFLMSVGLRDPKKAYQLWSEFKRLNWVPEFSYEFYLCMLQNSLKDWDIARKIYGYIFAMKPVFKMKKCTVQDYLLYPHQVEGVISVTLQTAIQNQDSEVIAKIIEESVVKNFTFNLDVYPLIFEYLRQINCPEDYLLRFVVSHSSLLSAKTVDNGTFEFLNAFVERYPSQVILRKVVDVPFFRKVCESFELSNTHIINYSGFISCFEALWRTPQQLATFCYTLELHAVMVTRLYDPEYSGLEITHPMIQQFQALLVENFKKLVTNYRRMHMDSIKCHPVVAHAVKMVDLPDDVRGYFTHPGDWDKSYPLDLSLLISESVTAGIKEFNRLVADGYTFNFGTYDALIDRKYITREIIWKSIELCIGDKESLANLANKIVHKSLSDTLPTLVLNHPLFEKKILPYLSDESLLRIAKNCSNFDDFITKIKFPQRFSTIALRAEYKLTVDYIYNQLFLLKRYNSIVEFNQTAPVVSIPILLKSCIRSGEYEEYKKLLKKYRKSLGEAFTTIHAEYLINELKIDEALSLLDSANKKEPYKHYDLHTFAMFLKSFETKITPRKDIEDTLQLANVLSSCGSFEELLSIYKSATSGGTLPYNKNLNQAVKLEILEQMLNSLNDAINFLDVNSEAIQDSFVIKLNNLMKFRHYLGLNNLSQKELTQLINIWRNAVPIGIDNLFNNIVETSYLKPDANVLHVTDKLTISFTKERIRALIGEIKNFYEEEGNNENLDKVKIFEGTLERPCELIS